MSRLASAIAWAELRGRDRGLRGPSSVWLAIWVLATAYRQFQRFTQPEVVVVRERLEPGQQLVVTHYPKGTEPPEPPKPEKRRRGRTR